jgi:muconolactone delta-isomerase
MEYLVTMTTHVPDGTPEQAVDDVRAREAAHSRDLATEGQLLRLWRPPLQPGRMAHSRLVCRRRRRPAPADPGFDATERYGAMIT